MDLVKEWAVTEFNKLTNGLYQEESISLFTNLCDEESTKISKELSNLLDYSVKENKAFIKDFVDKVKQAKAYQEKARRVASSTQ